MGATDPTNDTVEKKDEVVQPIDPKASVEGADEFPDPDEDDLDDLDDMLDDFSAAKITDDKAQKPAAASATEPSEKKTTSSTQAKVGEEGEFSEEDFAKQLHAGMADLLGDMDKNPEMQKEFENMLKQFSTAAEAATDGDGNPTTSTAGGDASFQDTIRRTMERMQSSGDQATAAAASGGADDFMSELLKQMSSGEFGNGEGSDEDFSKMLMGMMEQLTTKEILYEPMKDLHEKFPEWMEKNKAATPADDLKRYEEQQTLVKEIVERFEKPGYADTNSEDREYIIERMQKMQDAGSPPADLVGDMPSAQEALGGGDDCNPQ